MSIYDIIKNDAGNQPGMRPIAAFLIGRENKRQRERQEQNDQMRAESFDQQSELRGLQIEQIKNAPAQAQAQAEAEAAEQQRQGAIIITAIDSAEGLDPNQKDVLKRLVAAGREEDAVKALTALDKDAGSPFTLAPGSVRYGPDGKVIANNPKPPGSDGQSAAEEEIGRLMSIGLSRDQAIGVADGVIKLETDPAGGIVRLTNIKDALDGKPAVTELEIQPAGGAVPFPEVPTSQSLYAQSGEATGPTNIIQNALSKVSGAVGGPVDKRTVAATQYFAAAENTVIRAFSLNPRYPVAEQNRIKENIAITPRFFDSPELMQIRMRSIDSFLEQEQKMAEYFASQPGASRDQRTADKVTANGIMQFREQLKVPGAAAGTGIKILSRRPADAQ